MQSDKMIGRLAGLTYLLLGVTGGFQIMFVTSQVFVPADAEATLRAARAGESLLRLGVAAGVISNALFLVTPLLLYVLLARFGRIAAALIVLFAAASVPLSFAGFAHHLAILDLLRDGAGDARAVMGQFEAAARLQTMASVFWGLWLAPLGWLIAKSGVIPRPIGWVLMLACVGYLANFFAPLLFPPLAEASSLLAAAASTIGEFGVILWLLILGPSEKALARGGAA